MNIYTRQDVARLFGVSIRTLSHWLDDPAFHFPRPVSGPHKKIWSAQKIHEWIEQGGAPAGRRGRPRGPRGSL